MRAERPTHADAHVEDAVGALRCRPATSRAHSFAAQTKHGLREPDAGNCHKNYR